MTNNDAIQTATVIARIIHELESDDCTSVLVIGDRGIGKTCVCETVLASLNRHIVRWKPYEEFKVGRVNLATSQRGTIVFADDADVMVRLSKGCSTSLIQALTTCKQLPGVRVLLTSCDDRGRVWKPVADIVGKIIQIPSPLRVKVETPVRSHKAKSSRSGWASVLAHSKNVVASKQMRNWCALRDVDDDGIINVGSASDVKPIVETTADGAHVQDCEDGCDVRKIASLIVR